MIKRLQRLSFLYQQEFLGFSYTQTTLAIESGYFLPNNLADLRSSAKNCKLCSLWKTRQNVVFAPLPQTATKLMIISLAPSVNEDKLASLDLNIYAKLINKLNIEKSQIYATHLIKCKPSSNGFENTCKIYAQKEISLVKPKLVLVFDEFVLKALNKDLPNDKGLIVDLGEFSLMLTYSPSFLAKNPSKELEFANHCLKINEFLAKK